MKKFRLLAAAAVGLFVVSAASAQTDASTTTRTKRRTTTVNARNNAALNARLRRIETQSTRSITTTTPTSRIDGGVVRTVRSGNPLQMVNPFAPREYGNGTDVTRHEPDDPNQRPEGLKLFALEF